MTMKETLSQINSLKKELMMMQIKASSDNDSSLLKQRKTKKKEVARLFTKVNQKSIAKVNAKKI